MTRKQATADFKALEAAHAESLAAADAVLGEAYAADLIAHKFMSMTNKERNAYKRKTVGLVSPFTRGTNVESKSFKIDNALSEFHTSKELAKVLGYSEAFVLRHVKYLKDNFYTTCKMITEGKQFKFVSA